MVRILCSLCLGLLLVSTPTAAQSPPAITTTDRHDPFVRHAESRYRQYLASESRGDVAAYKAVRTREAYETVLDQLRRLGKSQGDLGAMLKRAAASQTDVSPFTFVRCDAKPRVARLLYRREGAGQRGPKVEFAVFMVRWDDGAWRIGWVGHADGAPTRVTADDLLGDPRFALE